MQDDPTDDFASFYDRTFDHVWRVLGRAGILREAEREELAQDVYVVAIRKRATRNRAVPERLWIGVVARQLGRRYRALARTRREQPVDEPEAVEEVRAVGATPEDLVGRRRRYLDLMSQVDDARREVFELHEVDGFSLSEIAAGLRIKLGTASTRLRLARADVAAAEARMRAGEARAEGRVAVAPMLLPFGAGAWREMDRLFEDAPSATRGRVWRAVCRGVARAAVDGGAALAGKAAAGLLFGAGFAGGVVAAVVAMRVFATEPAAAPTLARAPTAGAVVVGVAVAPSASANAEPSASAEPSATVAAAATVVRGGKATAAPSASARAPQSSVDPEEERLLGQAETAFGRGNRDAAKAALDDHARRFPRGALAAERERLRARLGAQDAGAPVGGPDAGRNPHRLLDLDE